MLLRSPGFSAAAIVVLALGLGSSIAIFTIVKSLILNPLPYPESGRLMWILSVTPNSPAGYRATSADDFKDLKSQVKSFSEMSGYISGSWNVTGIGEPQRIAGTRVMESFFDTLRVQPALGRAFRPDEYQSGREMVAMFSYTFWKSHLGGDPDVIGRRITMDGIPFEVAGVMPADFPLAAEFDLWAPLPRDSPLLSGRNAKYLSIFGRLRPEVSATQASGEVAAIASALAVRYPEDRASGMRAVTFLEQEIGSIRQTLWIFGSAVGCVLLIACMNVGSLLLARGASRNREMAIRAAAGASRVRLVRQLLAESMVIASMGALIGLPLAYGAIRMMVLIQPRALPRSGSIHVDGGVVLFTLALCALTAVVSGMLPALRTSAISLREGLAESGRSGMAGRKTARLRSSLVVIEVALGVVLLACAGLLARSLRELTAVKPGYDTHNVVTMRLALTSTRYRDPAQIVDYFNRLSSVIERLPGIEAAGSTNFLPLSPETSAVGLWVEGLPQTAETKIRVENRVVGPGYFRAMGVPLRSGRFFTWRDRANTAKAVIVNDVFARQLFPRGDAVGKRVMLELRQPFQAEIVGVVGSFQEAGLGEPPRREVFTAVSQTVIAGQTLVARTNGDPAGQIAQIRSAIASIDPDVPVYNIRTMTEQVSNSVAQPRLRSTLIGAFAMMALILASIGVYGVIACGVAERRKELGIRIALGANPSRMRTMILGEGLMLAGFGLILGLAGAAAATRLLEGLLFKVGAHDPLTYVGTALVFLAVAAAASYLPARRAMNSDPLRSLHDD